MIERGEIRFDTIYPSTNASSRMAELITVSCTIRFEKSPKMKNYVGSDLLGT